MRILLAAVLSTALLAGQAPTPAFEVATIKPNKADAVGTGGLGFAFDGIRARNQSPADLVRMAFNLQPNQVLGAPPWVSTERFDIIAKVAPGVVFNAMTMFGPMLTRLLEDRFQLRVHHETRQLNVYRLVRLRSDRLGPKIAPAPANACAPPSQTDAASLVAAGRGCSAGPMPGGVNVHGMGLSVLTSLIAPIAGRVIVDGTGLTGVWDLELTFVNHAQTPDADGPSLFTAVEEQLGLKLEPLRAPADVIVIDRLERPSDN